MSGLRMTEKLEVINWWHAGVKCWRRNHRSLFLSNWFTFRYGNYVAVHFISYTHGALHIARTGSVYVTMSVTLERYFAIVYPLKHFTIKKYLLPTTVFFAIAYNVPKVGEIYKFIYEEKHHNKYIQNKDEQNQPSESAKSSTLKAELVVKKLSANTILQDLIYSTNTS